MTELIRLFYTLDTYILKVSINLCHNQNQLPLFASAVFYHALKVGAIVVCARHSAVDIGFYNGYIVSFGILIAYSKFLYFLQTVRCAVMPIDRTNKNCP